LRNDPYTHFSQQPYNKLTWLVIFYFIFCFLFFSFCKKIIKYYKPHQLVVGLLCEMSVGIISLSDYYQSTWNVWMTWSVQWCTWQEDVGEVWHRGKCPRGLRPHGSTTLDSSSERVMEKELNSGSWWQYSHAHHEHLSLTFFILHLERVKRHREFWRCPGNGEKWKAKRASAAESWARESSRFFGSFMSPMFGGPSQSCKGVQFQVLLHFGSDLVASGLWDLLDSSFSFNKVWVWCKRCNQAQWYISSPCFYLFFFGFLSMWVCCIWLLFVV
jgi:hypothetical protein